MEPSQRSRTMELPAIMRALHQTLDREPKILIDPIAARLLDANDDRTWLAPLLDHPFAPQWRAGFALRARYAEDCLAAGVARGVRQYMILGAGFDTFAYRQPAWAARLQIYELDHPRTQAAKRDRLRAAAIALPANLTLVPIDFERTALPDALAATHFQFNVLTFCSWMGVTQYLTRDALDATFRFVRSLPPSSEIVFSLILPEAAVVGVEAAAMALAARRAEAVGEPWRTRLVADELAARLHELGFAQTIHLTPAQADTRYFANRADGLRARRGEQLMRAVV